MLQYNIHGYCDDSAAPVGDPGTTSVICTGAHFKYHTLLKWKRRRRLRRMLRRRKRLALPEEVISTPESMPSLVSSSVE